MVTQTKPLDDPEQQMINTLLDLLHTQYPGLASLDAQDTARATVNVAFALAVLLARIEIKGTTAIADSMQDYLIKRLTNERAELVKIAHATAAVAPATTRTPQ